MSEYVFDFDKFEEPDIATGLREPIVRCKDCGRSRIERHTGDNPLACWRYKTHGYVTPPDGFCHAGTPRENPCQITDENAAAFADAPTMESARGAAQTPTLALGA